MVFYNRIDHEAGYDPKTKKCGLIVIAIAMSIGIWLLIHGPIPQASEYHSFTDQRAIFGIPNFQNVFSNLPFLIVGILGMVKISTFSKEVRMAKMEPWPTSKAWFALFSGVLLTSFGSAWYHFAPSNDTLVWDRLPMSIGFMSLFAGILGENFGRKLFDGVFIPLILAGIGSVFYWYISELLGEGDLRLYLFFQFFPLLAIVIITTSLANPRGKPKFIWGAILLYVVAKVCEHFDSLIFEVTSHVLSGHAAKHLVASVACWFLYLNANRMVVSFNSDAGKLV